MSQLLTKTSILRNISHVRIITGISVQSYRGFARIPTKPALVNTTLFREKENPSEVLSLRCYSSQGGQVAEVFKKIEGALSEDVVAGTKAVFTFDVTGEEEGKWFLDLKNGSGSIGQGEGPGSDVTLTMATGDFIKMFTGKLNPTQAFMSGKLKMKGNMGKAMALEKLMKKMK